MSLERHLTPKPPFLLLEQTTTHFIRWDFFSIPLPPQKKSLWIFSSLNLTTHGIRNRDMSFLQTFPTLFYRLKFIWKQDVEFCPFQFSFVCILSAIWIYDDCDTELTRIFSCSNGLINLFVQFLPSSGARILETRSIRSLNNHLVTNNWWWLDLYILQSGKAFLYLFYCRKFQLPPQLALHNAFSSLNDWIYNFIGWTTLITTSSSWK